MLIIIVNYQLSILISKDRLSPSKRPSITMQKAVFYTLKGGLLRSR